MIMKIPSQIKRPLIWSLFMGKLVTVFPWKLFCFEFGNPKVTQYINVLKIFEEIR